MYHVFEPSFNFNNNCNRDLYSSQSLNEYSIHLALKSSGNNYLAPNLESFSPNILKNSFEVEENLSTMNADHQKPKYTSPSVNHFNPVHSNTFPSDNSCSYDSLIESDDSLNHSYVISDHVLSDRSAIRYRDSSKLRTPNHSENLTSEEEEKRKLRRERNKLAAARCRKRRLDHTNNLLKQTEDLEEKKHLLEVELIHLQQQKNDLEHCLRSHESECKSFVIKQTSYNLHLL